MNIRISCLFVKLCTTLLIAEATAPDPVDGQKETSNNGDVGIYAGNTENVLDTFPVNPRKAISKTWPFESSRIEYPKALQSFSEGDGKYKMLLVIGSEFFMDPQNVVSFTLTTRFSHELTLDIQAGNSESEQRQMTEEQTENYKMLTFVLSRDEGLGHYMRSTAYFKYDPEVSRIHVYITRILVGQDSMYAVECGHEGVFFPKLTDGAEATMIYPHQPTCGRLQLQGYHAGQSGGKMQEVNCRDVRVEAKLALMAVNYAMVRTESISGFLCNDQCDKKGASFFWCHTEPWKRRRRPGEYVWQEWDLCTKGPDISAFGFTCKKGTCKRWRPDMGKKDAQEGEDLHQCELADGNEHFKKDWCRVPSTGSMRQGMYTEKTPTSEKMSSAFTPTKITSKATTVKITISPKAGKGKSLSPKKAESKSPKATAKPRGKILTTKTKIMATTPKVTIPSPEAKSSPMRKIIVTIPPEKEKVTTFTTPKAKLTLILPSTTAKIATPSRKAESSSPTPIPTTPEVDIHTISNEAKDQKPNAKVKPNATPIPTTPEEPIQTTPEEPIQTTPESPSFIGGKKI